jgi:hypothetical protein
MALDPGAGDAKGQFNVVPITSKPAVTVGAENTLFDIDAPQAPTPTAMGFSVAPDGRRFLTARSTTPVGRAARRIVLVQNWMAALKK